MTALILVALTAIGVGYASAVFPLVNAEAVCIAGGALTDMTSALVVAISLAAGQTGGKLSIFAGVRAGGRRVNRSGPSHARTTWMAVRTQRLLTMLDRRPVAIGTVLVAGVVGLPPLLAVAFAAGASRMRMTDFGIFCFLGRCARFTAIAVPIVLAR